ncbi:class I SAM-dependent methyltransferase [Nonomuraea glycinis]|uniref:class I SAM-dependent methyltransferase n=1 Tax=Nonomuraea glycinis TaxID=2047744 RepID=UPI002E114EDE|nr:class I SAM-dependent methyltransferase [Nonomuraea glycinis]
MRDRRGKYGLDEPWAVGGLVLGAVLLFALAGISFVNDIPAVAVAFLFGALYTLASAASHLYTTRRGKFAVWDEALRELTGEEKVLDLGSGRGAVLLLAAKRLSHGTTTSHGTATGHGTAMGLDLWRPKGRASEAATRANADAEGVSDLVELTRGDMRELPFEDESYDVVVAGPAVHHISDAEGRAGAIREAHRVLRPGGLLLIADHEHVPAYETVLRGLGVVDVQRRDLGWRYWHGGPWAKTWMLRARKP